MDVSGQRHAPAACSPEKDLRYPMATRLGGPNAGLDAVAKKKKNPCFWRESNSGHLARSVVTILTELSWLLYCYYNIKL
jgi:hypothetical protein